jgi:hypothetical protein
MAKHSLNFCRREGGEANSLRSNSLPSFSSLQQKFKAPSRAGDDHTVAVRALALGRIASLATLCGGVEVLNFDSEVLER